jgi:hypothetical protein
MKKMMLGALLFLLAPASAMSAVLYKSIGPNGVVEFSDVPPSDGNSRVVATGVLASSASSAGSIPGEPAAAPNGDGMPMYEDGALARANAQLDLAEHALAEALRAIGSPLTGMRLSAHRPTPADSQRIDFFRRNVQLARTNLMELLHARQPATTVASR